MSARVDLSSRTDARSLRPCPCACDLPFQTAVGWLTPRVGKPSRRLGSQFSARPEALVRSSAAARCPSPDAWFRLRVSHKGFRPAGLMEYRLMGQNFIDCDCEQVFLMPPSLREWLPGDHLAWFVLSTVEQLDLEAFLAAYRGDGHGRAAYDPQMMVALLVYAYSTNVLSSRQIERHCRQDIAYRVITGNRVPDHATIARFVCRHETALSELFGGVLDLCASAGLVESGVVAIDGSKVQANASRDAMVDYDQIARELIAHARQVDRAEDEQHGEKRGDELPEELQSEEGRRAWLVR